MEESWHSLISSSKCDKEPWGLATPTVYPCCAKLTEHLCRGALGNHEDCQCICASGASSRPGCAGLPPCTAAGLHVPGPHPMRTTTKMGIWGTPHSSPKFRIWLPIILFGQTSVETLVLDVPTCHSVF